MTDARPEINALIIDCADPDRLASFWGQVLGRPVAGRTGPYLWLNRENGLGLGFQQVTEVKSGKNRMHFDITSPDPVAERRRVESLGGQRAAGYEAGGFLVMADPEGNEFCIIPEGPFELDDDGHTDYLTGG